jgi:large subunit ribosomal protein L5
MARLLEKYKKEVIPALQKKYKYKNMMQVPRLVKIVINVGMSDARDNVNVVEIVKNEITSITGQAPIITKAKKSISNFKLREGMPIGCVVTLRGPKMYEFLDRLISVSIPRIRDFKGLNPSAFDSNGNYNLGLTEQHIFPEINAEKSDKARGMNITFVTTTKNKEVALDLLKFFGMPFRDKK